MMMLFEMEVGISAVPSLRWLWAGSTGALALRGACATKQEVQRDGKPHHSRRAGEMRMGDQKLCLGEKSALVVRMKQVPSPAS